MRCISINKNIEINSLPLEILKQILILVLMDSDNPQSIPRTCKLWNKLLYTEIKSMLQVRCILKDLKKFSENEKINLDKEWKALGPNDIASKIMLRTKSVINLRNKFNEFIAQLEAFSENSKNSYAQLELFKIYGAGIFDKIVEEKTNKNHKIYSFLLSDEKKNLNKAFIYLQKAAQHNYYAELLLEKFKLSDSFFLA